MKLNAMAPERPSDPRSFRTTAAHVTLVHNREAIQYLRRLNHACTIPWQGYSLATFREHVWSLCCCLLCCAAPAHADENMGQGDNDMDLDDVDGGSNPLLVFFFHACGLGYISLASWFL